jgi:hypothetical protein
LSIDTTKLSAEEAADAVIAALSSEVKRNGANEFQSKTD